MLLLDGKIIVIAYNLLLFLKIDDPRVMSSGEDKELSPRLITASLVIAHPPQQ